MTETLFEITYCADGHIRCSCGWESGYVGIGEWVKLDHDHFDSGADAWQVRARDWFRLPTVIFRWFR